MIKKCKGMEQWVEGDTNNVTVDLILEWLHDSEMLNEEGEKFAHAFWHFTWHKKEEIKKCKDCKK